MGMMVVGRKVVETADEVRYEFGLDRRFDRVLTIDKQTWQISTEDGRLDSAAGALAAKIQRVWQQDGEFPPGVVFAS
ncbi:hypothetical protein ACFQFC_16390 [Amorphoplanes digitatis]|uniref:Uncharacterized protein n=1 Tax=Actinoplanes digitatis TaxID=1868 RepID=A0A7W7I3L7_9ACTN|nr:hypothetical protein [Actinoplanes digitatis]MBB4765794.1 hypothetical protein [Actinoplanes digitatis]BFE75706.1 hypothetical protein GCM10020092_090070 [Actinoplanes digitatis]GID93414.1 hypothetical protein Adi01nite_28260 [Actinoplanes digitatis]